MRKFGLLVALVVLAFAILMPSPTAAQGGSCTNTLTQPSGQSFWIGSLTATNANRAVVVLVHGYTGDRTTWLATNYTVRDGCNNGFRVAVVELGAESSLWDNAQNLANQLNAIAAYYNVSELNIMAHSKGGLDSQAAIVFYGAHTRVQSYIAMGTPFGGTDLANHACSWYGSWLWQCNDATRDMRTGNMSYVRSITDPRPENGFVNAYAVRGSKCDWYNPACALISGADDGVVPTWSVWANGVDTHISDRSDLRHGEVHQSQRYNSAWLFSYLGQSAEFAEVNESEGRDAPLIESAYTLRGGDFRTQAAESVTVEAGLNSLNLSVITTGAARVTAISPTGQRYDLASGATPADAILRGVQHTATVNRPDAGQWRVTLSASNSRPTAAERTGYYLRATFNGGVTIAVVNDLRTVLQPGGQLELQLAPSVAVNDLHVTTTLRDSEQNVATLQNGGVEQRVALPTTAGIYNVEINMTGTTATGSPFERTLVTSVAVVDIATVTDPAAIR